MTAPGWLHPANPICPSVAWVRNRTLPVYEEYYVARFIKVKATLFITIYVYTVKQRRNEAMQKQIPRGGYLVKLNRPEDKNLFTIATTLAEEAAGRDLTNGQFLVALMKNYAENRTVDIGK
jgi:hypothetical protein